MSDLERVQLVARTPCERCDGEGERQSDDWEAFEEWCKRRSPNTPWDEDELAERYFLEVCGYGAVPPMREACEECDGTGWSESLVPVPELVEAVLEEVERPLLPAGELDEMVARVKQSITDAASASQGLAVADAEGTGSWLRAVQEGAEALRSLGELRARRAL